MAGQEHKTPTEPEKAETELVAQLLGSDPWMRFDVWANRSWEAAEQAMRLAADGQAIITEDAMDGRVLAAFHAAQIAKEFAEMVNPLFAAAHSEHVSLISSDSQARAIMSLVLDDDD